MTLIIMTQLRECNDHLCHQPQLAAGGVRGGERLSDHRQPSDKASLYSYICITYFGLNLPPKGLVIQSETFRSESFESFGGLLPLLPVRLILILVN